MTTSDENGSGEKAPPPLVTELLSSIIKNKRQYNESNRQLVQRYFDMLLEKYEVDWRDFRIEMVTIS